MALRNYSVDVARGALMLYIVAVIHGIFWLWLLPTKLGALFLFEMPCVFIITGYAYFLYQAMPARKNSEMGVASYIEFLLGRFTRILIPYFFYAVFCIGYSYVVREPEWSMSEIVMAWLNPFQYGRGHRVGMLNWHLWFIPPYLAVTALLPLATRITLPVKMPLWAYMLCSAAAVFLCSLVQIDLLSSVLSYGLWAVFGYHLAKVNLLATRNDYLRVLAAALLTLLAFALFLPAGYSLHMQENKFPPNFIFFVFCAAWIAFFLVVLPLLPTALPEKLSRQVWLRPFIKSGYSIYIWQGAGYSLAAYVGSTYHYSKYIVWGIALVLTVIFGMLASPLERLRFRK